MSIISPNNKWLRRGLQISKSIAFQAILGRAGTLVTKPYKIFSLLKKAGKKTEKYSTTGEFASGLKSGILTMSQLVNASVRGQYNGVSKRDVVLVIAAILYFVSPFDLVPDAIPFVGILDDISILSWVINKLATEVEDFVNWQNLQVEAVNLENLTYVELYNIAQKRDVTGRSGMKKSELLKALSNQN